jgi:hypothetical protein
MIGDPPIAGLDNRWRTASTVRNRLGLKGQRRTEQLVDELRRLAELGAIERKAIDTKVPKVGHDHKGPSPGTFIVEYFRNKQ